MRQVFKGFAPYGKGLKPKYKEPSLVRVYRMLLDGTKKFMGYQDKHGRWVDEGGVPLGKVEFKRKGRRG